MALPKLLEMLFGNGGAGEKLKPEIIPPATGTTIGGVKAGSGVNVASDGSLTVDPPVIAATASVSASTGTPSVSVTKGGTNKNPTFGFAFAGLKGETGPQGPKGNTGATGPQGPAGTNAYLEQVGAAGSYGQGSNSTANGAKTIYVPSFTVDAYGRVTAAASRQVYVPGTGTCNNCSECNNANP